MSDHVWPCRVCWGRGWYRDGPDYNRTREDCETCCGTGEERRSDATGDEVWRIQRATRREQMSAGICGEYAESLFRGFAT